MNVQTGKALSAETRIREDLSNANRRRAVMGAVFLVSLTAGVAALAYLRGIVEIDARRGLVFAVLAAMIIVGVWFASSPRVRLSPVVTGVLVVAGLAVPVLVATRFQPLDINTVGNCLLSTLSFGAAALLAARLIFGTNRRRFGGAAPILAASAGLSGALFAGLGCPATDLAHLGVHTLATAVVVGAGMWLFLR